VIFIYPTKSEKLKTVRKAEKGLNEAKEEKKVRKCTHSVNDSGTFARILSLTLVNGG
jgi:hypothetical protein